MHTDQPQHGYAFHQKHHFLRERREHLAEEISSEHVSREQRLHTAIKVKYFLCRGVLQLH